MCDQFTLHHEFRIDTGRTKFEQKTDCISSRLWILWTKNTKILIQSTWKHRVLLGTSRKCGRDIKHCIGLTSNLLQWKGFKFSQTRSNAIILYDTLPAYCIPKVWTEHPHTSHFLVFDIGSRCLVRITSFHHAFGCAFDLILFDPPFCTLHRLSHLFILLFFIFFFHAGWFGEKSHAYFREWGVRHFGRQQSSHRLWAQHHRQLPHLREPGAQSDQAYPVAKRLNTLLRFTVDFSNHRVLIDFRKTLGLRPTDQSCHHETWLHLDFVDGSNKWSNQDDYDGNIHLKERAADYS